MKILEITFEAPSKKSGGGIVIIQSIKSLLKCGEVDYIGPDYDNGLFEDDNLHTVGHLAFSNKPLKKIRYFFEGATTGYYRSWKEILQTISWEKYDIVSIEFTRYSFLVKEAKKHSLPTIVRIHNVEKDYFHNLYASTRKYSRRLQELYYEGQERKCIASADGLLALTSEDKMRVEELYGEQNGKKVVVNPVCIEEVVHEPYERRDEFLITGSLWYGPNADGVIWFLENVWTQINSNGFRLIIAGSRPCDQIKELSNSCDNVTVIENPEDMTSIFLRAKYYIAPIFTGAGMKVKIAEAMMYGLPILATPHALIGYELNVATRMVETEEQFKAEINLLSKLDANRYMELSTAQRNRFAAHYSINTSANNYLKLMNSMCEHKEILR